MGIERRSQRRRRHRVNPTATLSDAALDIHRPCPQVRTTSCTTPSRPEPQNQRSAHNPQPDRSEEHTYSTLIDNADIEPPTAPLPTFREPHALESRQNRVINSASKPPDSSPRDLPNTAPDPVSSVGTASRSDISDVETSGDVSDLNDILNNYSDSAFFGYEALEVFEQEFDDEHITPDVVLTENSKRLSYTTDQQQEIEAATLILTTLQKRMSRTNVLAFITIYGQSRFSLAAYKHLSSVMHEYAKMPSASAVRLRIFPYLLENLTVQSTAGTFPSKDGLLGAVKRVLSSGDTSTSLQEGKCNKAIIVLPSAWARLDLRCYHTFKEIVCAGSCRCHPSSKDTDIRIEASQHVQRKSQCHAKHACLWVSKKGVPYPAHQGTTVSLHTFVDQSLPPSILSDTNIRFYTKKYKKEDCNCFNASVLHTYSVQHSSTIGAFFQASQGSSSSQLNSPTVRKYLTYMERFLPAQQPSTSHEPDSTKLNDQSANGFTLAVGDYITFLSASEEFDEKVIVVFVSRFWSSRLNSDQQLIIFLQSSQESSSITFSSLPSFGVPEFIKYVPKERATTQDRIEQQPCYTKGVLPDGSNFYTYRLLLYADDFNPRSQMFPRGSVGGVYMAPAGFSVKTRRSQKTIRTISLTPAGVSTNHVLEFLIEDLVNGSLDGFQCLDPLGKPAMCFFDIVGFLADYPASSAAIDVLGHTSLAPCTHCSFVLLRSLIRSKYAFTTIIHSCHSAFRRTQNRTEALRSAGLIQEDAKTLGLKSTSHSNNRSKGFAPLLTLCARYNERLADRVSPTIFNSQQLDGYDLNIIAPDHLLTGLMKGILYCTFVQLPSDIDRDNLQIVLKSCLLDFGFQSQSYIYKNKKLVPGLSMSMVYAMFMVLPAVLSSMGQLDDIPTKDILLHLHTFFCLGFWWPSRSLDGLEAWQFVHGDKQQLYHDALHKIACNFVNAVDRYVRKNRKLGKYVDRPNTHRLLELTLHTIPKFGHLLFVCELVFESAHQPLKFLLSRNFTSNSHLNSVQVMLVKDWIYRVWNLWLLYKSESSSQYDKQASVSSLLRLFCGSTYDLFTWDAPHLSDIKSQLITHIEKVMNGTMENIFNDWFGDAVPDISSDGAWVVTSTMSRENISATQMAVLESGRATLASILTTPLANMQFAAQVNFQRGGTRSSRTPHERLRLGDVVELLCNFNHKSHRFIQLSDDGRGDKQFFVVGGIIQCTSTEIWLLAKRCIVSAPTASSSSNLPNYNLPLLTTAQIPAFYSIESTGSSPTLFLRLDSRVRRVGLVHNCIEDKGCSFSTNNRTACHSKSTLQGGNYYLLTRTIGYPPRRS